MRFDSFAPFFALIPLGFVGWLLFRVVRHGGLVGAMVGARSREVVGEVESERVAGVRQVFRVHVLAPEPGQGPLLGLQTVTYAWGTRKTTAVRLSAAQARELAAILTRAAGR
jgi:hypothetical protein